jgi:hypothetical protein
VYASGTLTITRLFGKMTDAQRGYGANLGVGKVLAVWRRPDFWR